MPYQPSVGSNDAFLSGKSPLTNSGRGNDFSHTLGDVASSADQGLDATSARWNASTPRSVLQSVVGGSPSQTTMTADFAAQSLGDTGNADITQASVDRSMQLRAAGIGSNDGVD